MTGLLSVLSFTLCVSICSLAKIEDLNNGKTHNLEKEKHPKTEMIETTTAIHQDEITYRHPMTGEIIPKEWVEMHGIKEDPLGEKEREIFGMNPEDMAREWIPERNATLEKLRNELESLIEESNITESEDSNSTCRTCELREEDRRMRIESIKSTILSKLGFSSEHLPNMTGKKIPRIPSIQRLIDEYTMQGDAPYGTPDHSYYPEEDEYYGQVQRAYTIAQPLPDHLGLHLSGSAYFELPESVTSRRVQTASLWFYLRNPHGKSKQKVTEIYLYIVHSKTKSHNIKKSPMEYMKTSTYGWQEFKLSRVVHHWIKNPSSNRGVIIQALDEDGNNMVVYPGENADESYIPMLEMATVEKHDNEHRQKRSFLNICSEVHRIETCCRYPLRVDFVQFGWDWVIAPTGYKANYCSGECRHRQIDISPQAYLIQQTGDGTGPCCTPSKMYPLAMLYFDHNHTVLYTYMHKMIVERCGCA